MKDGPYRKDYLVGTRIARGLLAQQAGYRLPTIEEYTKKLDCSRGLVQNALAQLEESGAVRLDRRGKSGTYLLAKDEALLFAGAGLHFFTGSMPAPLNIQLAGLATGVCQAMGRCTVPYTFAFVQGAKNRVDALLRQVYDFIIVTKATALEHMALHPELEIAFPLAGCEYSPPYRLHIKPGAQGLEEGMTVAVDPSSTDQWDLTQLVCQDKNVKLVHMPYISTGLAFLSGEVDAVVHRDDILASPAGGQVLAVPFAPRIALADVTSLPIPEGQAPDMQLPVVLVNRKNEGIAGILRQYLGDEVVAYVQGRVVGYQMVPQFY